MGLVGAGHLQLFKELAFQLSNLTKLDLPVKIPLRSWVKKKRNPYKPDQETAHAAKLAHKLAAAIVLLDSFGGVLSRKEFLCIYAYTKGLFFHLCKVKTYWNHKLHPG